MKTLTASTTKSITRMAFGLIPLSGFALDIFIPSLPAIASDLHTTPAAVQLTLSIFLISLGVFQLFIGSILDSFGRYLPNVLALAIFSFSSFVIAASDSITIIYIMRALQGACVATIVVSKRAVLVDLHSGEQLKKYMSMLSVVWSAAPIIAPFIGGFLQVHFGWRSNFSFLGFVGVVLMVLEFVFDKETIKIRHPFNIKAINDAYMTMIKAKDFTFGLVILGLCYTMLMVYGMTSPFIIEKVLHFTPTVTGNASLVSGVAFMFGGLLSQKMISKPFYRKILISVILMLVAAALIMVAAAIHPTLYTLLAYVITLHFALGLVFNTVFSYALTRFTHLGGKAGGLAGGVYIILTSAMSQSVVSTFNIKTQVELGSVYFALTIIILLIFVSTKWLLDHANKKAVTPDTSAGKNSVVEFAH